MRFLQGAAAIAVKTVTRRRRGVRLLAAGQRIAVSTTYDVVDLAHFGLSDVDAHRLEDRNQSLPERLEVRLGVEHIDDLQGIRCAVARVV